MSKIKVLHIIKSLGRGGAEVLLLETLKVHDKEKFEFHYIYFVPWKNQMADGIRAEGGIVVNFSASNNLNILTKVFNVIAYIRKNNITLVHCHLPWAGFLGRIICKLTKTKVIYTEHNLQERYHPITRFINKYTYNWQKKVIAVSEDVENSIQSSIQPSVAVEIIPNGINVDRFRRNTMEGERLKKTLNITSNNVVIGNVGVFRSQKRLKEWITLFKSVYTHFPHVRGCIIGDGLLKEEIETHLKKEGMENVISLPGIQTNIVSWLSFIDIFLMTSEFEGMPVALLEAMSMNCAIVTTDAGGVKQIVRNEIDGFVENVNHWRELRKPLTYLIEHPQEIVSYGKKARLRAESFDIKKMTTRLECLYQSFFV